MSKLSTQTKWYLVLYYDANGNSIEAVKYDQEEIESYLEPEQLQTLNSNRMVGIQAPESWKSEYGVHSYTVREL
jgi:hypothetical protein